MTWPAMGSVMCRLDAMSGSRPMATNSVVPMAKLPTASASTASQRTDGGGETTESATVGRSIDRVIGPTIVTLTPFLNSTYVFQNTKVARLKYLRFNRRHGHQGRAKRREGHQ